MNDGRGPCRLPLPSKSLQYYLLFSYDISVAIFVKRFINFYRKEKRPRPQFECLIVTFNWICIVFFLVSAETEPISHIRHNRS